RLPINRTRLRSPFNGPVRAARPRYRSLRIRRCLALRRRKSPAAPDNGRSFDYLTRLRRPPGPIASRRTGSSAVARFRSRSERARCSIRCNCQLSRSSNVHLRCEDSMQCNLYGKLPTKRDFIALGAPRDFLNVWQPWLQGGVSASQAILKEQWQQAFLRAPIWRFWLGADLCGTAVLGAFMPSLDKVGRYFPLTLFACADQEAAIPPPELDSQDKWFEVAEDLLIATLDHDRTFETTVADLNALAVPLQTEFPKASAADIFVEGDRTVGVKAGERHFADLFG